MQKLIAVVMICFLSILTACSDSSSTPASPPPPFELLIEADDQNIHIGNRTYLRAYSRDLASGEVSDITSMVSFSSDNPDIATIEHFGNTVIALAEGEASFSIDYNGQSTNTVIHVRDGYITQITVDSSDNHLHVGSTSQLTAIATYDDNSTDDITDSSEWVSEIQWVAYIRKDTPSVYLYADRPGTTEVYALRDVIQSNNQTVSVHRGTMVDFEINSSACCTVHKGQTISFNALSYWADGDTDNVVNSTRWSTGNSRVLKQQDNQYSFQAKETGSSTVSGSYNGFDDHKKVVVERALVTSLRVEMDADIIDIDRIGTNYWIPEGGSTQLTAIGNLSDGTQNANVSDLVEWHWFNEGTEGAIRIDEDFVAHALSNGKGVIYVSVDGIYSEYRGATLWINTLPESPEDNLPE